MMGDRTGARSRDAPTPGIGLPSSIDTIPMAAVPQFPTPCDNRLGRQKCANSWLMRRSKMPPRLLGARYPLQIRLQYRVALLTRQQWVKFL
jgi:hypothetical protein